MILLLLGIYLINHFINKRTWLPFQNTLHYIHHFDLEKSTIKEFEKLKIEEFNELNQSINGLLQRAKGTFIAQKEFTENASHELQTPLSVLKSKLELFLQQDSLTKKQSKLIDEMSNVISQLEQLNKSLLLLTKIDNLQYSLQENLPVESIILKAKEDLSFITDFTLQTIQVRMNHELIHTGNLLLFQHLISNLLTNALHYSPKNSKIEILINQDSICIINEGDAFNFPEEQLFHRFSKKHQKATRNGLGLAISYKIALLHSLQLSHQFDDGKHFFTIHI